MVFVRWGSRCPSGAHFHRPSASSLIVLLIFLSFLTTAHYWHLLLFRCFYSSSNQLVKLVLSFLLFTRRLALAPSTE